MAEGKVSLIFPVMFFCFNHLLRPDLHWQSSIRNISGNGHHHHRRPHPLTFPLCGFWSSTWSRSPLQKALCAEVFIYVWPMYSVPRSSNFPVFALFRCRVQQTRVPGQGNRYDPSVKKLHADCIVSEAYVPDSFSYFRFQSIHPMPPIILFGFRW